MKLSIDEKKEKFEKDLIYSFSQWQNQYENGSCDPTWSDGINLNLLRNHIIFYKRKLEEVAYYPEVYYRESNEVIFGYDRSGFLSAEAYRTGFVNIKNAISEINILMASDKAKDCLREKYEVVDGQGNSIWSVTIY